MGHGPAVVGNKTIGMQAGSAAQQLEEAAAMQLMMQHPVDPCGVLVAAGHHVMAG
jgi:hypothetical protein